ncbi:hypothetical protein [Caenimonas sp. SL110]|uniref:hypothetical protein n=1 Tax=Caenimonas sp. SL110 TaxID=1450524 RepID=UPI000654B98D|nr:hypothetical protein [Caenimonas sp. SL110]
MEKIIVYLDDAEYAQQQLAPMLAARTGRAGGVNTHWVLVACAPRMTRRISKWVSHSARENWRAKWSEKLFAAVTPQLRADGDEVTMELAKGPLCDLSSQLVGKHGACRILDARRPKFGHPMEPVTEDQRAATGAKWEVPGAVAGLGAMLVLAAE